MCFISVYIVYWIHFQNIHTFSYQKISTSYTFLLVFKIVESLQCILNPTNTPREFHVETTWKRPFPRRFNVELTWCVCREVFSPVDMTKSAFFFFFADLVTFSEEALKGKFIFCAVKETSHLVFIKNQLSFVLRLESAHLI